MVSRLPFYGSRVLAQAYRVLSHARKITIASTPSPAEISSKSGRSGYTRYPRATFRQQAALAGARGRGGSKTDAIKTLEDVKQSGRRLSPKLYTWAISTYGKRKQWQKAMELFREMEGEGIAPNVISYNSIISACANGGQGEQAIDLLREMDEKGIPPNVRSYNFVIMACGWTGGMWDAELAIKLLREMEGKGIKPNVFSYNSAIKACADMHEGERAMELLREMEGKSIEPNETSYKDTIEACSLGKGKWELEDVVSYNVAIKHFGDGGHWEHAIKFLLDMEAKGIPSNVVSYSVAIKACRDGGQWEMAVQLFHEMKGKRIEPNGIIYNSVIRAYGNGGDWKLAIKLLGEMERTGIAPGVFAYNSTIIALLRSSRPRCRREEIASRGKVSIADRESDGGGGSARGVGGGGGDDGCRDGLVAVIDNNNGAGEVLRKWRAVAVIDNNNGSGKMFDLRKWRATPKLEPVELSREGRWGELEYLCSTADNLEKAEPKRFPDFRTTKDNEHGLNKSKYGIMKKLCARLKVVIQVRWMDSDSNAPIFSTLVRATDDEIRSALEEDDAGSAISVDLYKRAVPLIRSRQAASKATKKTTSTKAAAAANG